MRRAIGEYSAGMLQRLGLAQAMLGKPPLVILDEPTANLDPMGRKKVLEYITTLSKEGVSFLISSHILTELERVCNYLVLINKGIILEKGDVEDLARKYHAYEVEVTGLNSSDIEELRRSNLVGEIKMTEDKFIIYTSNPKKLRTLLPRNATIVVREGAMLEKIYMNVVEKHTQQATIP